MSTISIKLKSAIRLPLLDQAVVSGNNFLQGVVLARALGASVFGAWAAGQLGLLLFLSLNQAFVTSPMLTFIGKKDALHRVQYVHTLVWVQGAVAVLCGLAAYIAAPFVFKIENLSPVQFGAAVAVLLMWDFFRRQLIALGKNQAVLGFDVLLFCIQTGGFLVCSFLKAISLPLAWMIWTGSYFLVSALCLAVHFKPKDKIKTAEVLQVSSEHWRDGRWLLLTALLQWFAGNYFVVSSAVWIGQAAMGIARMAQNILGVLNVVMISLENTLPVAAAAAFKENGWSGLKQVLAQQTKRSLPLVALFLGVFGIFGTVLFAVLFGEVPEGTSTVIWGYVGVYALTFLALPLRIALRTIGKNQAIFASYVVSTCFALCFAPVFLKYWKMTGMVAGMVICQLLQLMVCLMWLNRHSTNTTNQ